MTYRSNIGVSPRTIYVSKGGNDSLSGQTEEQAVETIAQAITLIGQLDPPVSQTNPATILMAASGTFDETVSLTEGTQFGGLNSFIFTTTGNAIEPAAQALFSVTSAGCFADDASCIRVSGKDRVGVVLTALEVFSEGGQGIYIDGSSDNAFFTMGEIVLSGEGSRGVRDETSNGSPEVYNIASITLGADNTTGFFHNPTDSGSTAVLRCGFIGEVAAVVNSAGFVVADGHLSALVNEINADTAINIIGGSADVVCNDVTGDITVAVGATLNCDISNHTGTITNNGTIQGRIGQEIFGDFGFSNNVIVAGDLTVQGTLTSVDQETLLVSDPYINTGSGYTSTVQQSGGTVVNLGSEGTTDSVTGGAFTAGVPATSNPTVITDTADVFAQNDIIQITGAVDDENNNIYEVEDHTGTTLTIRGVGTVDTVEDFTKRDFTANASDNATITKINVGILRLDTSGNAQTATGNTTPIPYQTLDSGSVNGPISSTNNSIATWNGTGGDTLNDNPNVSIVETASEVRLELKTPSATGSAKLEISDDGGSPVTEWDYDQDADTVDILVGGTSDFVVGTNSGNFTLQSNSGQITLDTNGDVSVNGDDFSVLAASGNIQLVCNSAGGTNQFLIEALNRDGVDPFATFSNAFGTNGGVFNLHINENGGTGITSDTCALVIDPTSGANDILIGNNTDGFVSLVSGGGDVSGPGSSTVGYFPAWNNTAGTLLDNQSYFSHASLPGTLNEVRVDSAGASGAAAYILRNNAGLTHAEMRYDESSGRMLLECTQSGGIDIVASSGGISMVTDANALAATFEMQAPNLAESIPILQMGNASGTFEFYVLNNDPEGALDAGRALVIKDTEDGLADIFFRTGSGTGTSDYVSLTASGSSGNVTGPTTPTLNSLPIWDSASSPELRSVANILYSDDGLDAELRLDIPAAGGSFAFILGDELGNDHYDLVYNDATNSSSLNTLGNFTASSGANITLSSTAGITQTAGTSISQTATAGNIVQTAASGEISLASPTLNLGNRSQYLETGTGTFMQMVSGATDDSVGLEFQTSTSAPAFSVLYNENTNESIMAVGGLGLEIVTTQPASVIEFNAANDFVVGAENSVTLNSTSDDINLGALQGNIALQSPTINIHNHGAYIETATTAQIDIQCPSAAGQALLRLENSTGLTGGFLQYDDTNDTFSMQGGQTGGISISTSNNADINITASGSTFIEGAVEFENTGSIAAVSLQVPATDGIVEYNIADSTGTEIAYWRYTESSGLLEIDAPNSDIYINPGTDEVLRFNDNAIRSTNSSLDSYWDIHIPSDTGEGGMRVYDENDTLVFTVDHDDLTNECTIEALSSGDQLILGAQNQAVRIQTQSAGTAPPVLELSNNTEVAEISVYNDDPNGNIASDSGIAIRIEDSVANSIYMAKTANSFAEVQWAQQKMLIQEGTNPTLTREHTLILAESTVATTYTLPTPSNDGAGIGWTQNILKLSSIEDTVTFPSINQGGFTGPMVIARNGDTMAYVQDGTATHLWYTNRDASAEMQRTFAAGETTRNGNTGVAQQLDIFNDQISTYPDLVEADTANDDFDFPTIENPLGDLYEMELQVSMRGTTDNQINFVITVSDDGATSNTPIFMEHVFSSLTNIVTVTGRQQFRTGDTGTQIAWPAFILPTGAQVLFSACRVKVSKVERAS